MGWAKRTAGVKEGDTVAYSKHFLQCTGQYTGAAPLVRGRVTGLTTLGEVVLAAIAWDCPDLPGRVNVRNLSLVRDGQVMDRD